MLEVCVDSLESALNAIHGQADELEVCSSLAEGGLTPSVGLVRQIINAVNKISTRQLIYRACSIQCPCIKFIKKPKVNVMIRCRTGSEFCYNMQEMDTMIEDVKTFKEMEIDRFVFGALTDAKLIDVVNCSKVVQEALPIPITFHRAFDMCADPISAIKLLIDLGFSRVLTSGQRSTAADPEALLLIKSLVARYGDEIEVMPGAGVTADNVQEFAKVGCKIVHSSCKTMKKLNNETSISMGTNESEFIYITDEDKVKKTVKNLTL